MKFPQKLFQFLSVAIGKKALRKMFAAPPTVHASVKSGELTPAQLAEALYRLSLH